MINKNKNNKDVKSLKLAAIAFLFMCAHVAAESNGSGQSASSVTRQKNDSSEAATWVVKQVRSNSAGYGSFSFQDKFTVVDDESSSSDGSTLPDLFRLYPNAVFMDKKNAYLFFPKGMLQHPGIAYVSEHTTLDQLLLDKELEDGWGNIYKADWDGSTTEHIRHLRPKETVRDALKEIITLESTQTGETPVSVSSGPVSLNFKPTPRRVQPTITGASTSAGSLQPSQDPPQVKEVKTKNDDSYIIRNVSISEDALEKLEPIQDQLITRSEVIKILGLSEADKKKLPMTNFIFKEGFLRAVTPPKVIVGNLSEIEESYGINSGTIYDYLIGDNSDRVIIGRRGMSNVYYVRNAKLLFIVTLSTTPDLNGIDVNQEPEKVLLDVFTRFLPSSDSRVTQINFVPVSHSDSEYDELEKFSIRRKLDNEPPKTPKGLLKVYLDATNLLVAHRLLSFLSTNIAPSTFYV